MKRRAVRPLKPNYATNVLLDPIGPQLLKRECQITIIHVITSKSSDSLDMNQMKVAYREVYEVQDQLTTLTATNPISQTYL